MLVLLLVKKLSIDVNLIKRSFYVSCNCILGNTKSMDEILKLSLIESHCLPILTYATVAMKLSKAQVNELNICWNSMYRQVFEFNKWESVRSFINGIGRLDFFHLRLYLRLKFYTSGLVTSNFTYNYMMKLHYLSDSFKMLCSEVGLSTEDYRRFIYLPIYRLKQTVISKFIMSL